MKEKRFNEGDCVILCSRNSDEERTCYVESVTDDSIFVDGKEYNAKWHYANDPNNNFYFTEPTPEILSRIYDKKYHDFLVSNFKGIIASKLTLDQLIAIYKIAGLPNLYDPNYMQ